MKNSSLLLIITGFFCIYLYNAFCLPLFQWDESRLGVNALEMLKSHNFITTTYQGVADNWNTKPPFAIWMMCLSLKLIGYTELGLRFPSVLFSVLTFLFVIFVLIKEKIFTNSISILFLIILFTSIGYSGYHIAITADYDAILVFFFTSFYISVYFAFQYINIDKQKYFTYSTLAILFFTFGIFTKGITICLSLPGLILYVFIFKKTKYFIKRENIGIFILLLTSILSIIFYYYYRNLQSPEYLKSVVHNEFGGRFLGGLENHFESNFYYLDNIFYRRFSIFIWSLLIIPIIFISRINKDHKLKSISIYILIIIINFLLVISLAKTKLDWYDAPIYPFLAIQITIILFVIVREFNNYSKTTWIIISIISIFSFRNIFIHYKDLKSLNKFPVEENSAQLKKYITKYNPNRIDVLCSGYQAHLYCYKLLLENKNISLYTNTYEALPQESENVYITSKVDSIHIVKMFYNHEIIDSNIYGYVFKLNGINMTNVYKYIVSEKKSIYKNKEWLNSIKKKSEINKITLDRQILCDIIYISENTNKFINKSIKNRLLN